MVKFILRLMKILGTHFYNSINFPANDNLMETFCIDALKDLCEKYNCSNTLFRLALDKIEKLFQEPQSKKLHLT